MGEVDLRPNKDDKPCQCGIDLISSDHLISKCRLFGKERDRIYGLNIATALLSKEMILDKDFGPGIRDLAKKIGLGYGPDIRWERLDTASQRQETSSDDGSIDEKFKDFE
jgi:hypothetical protein